jgi:ribose transport system ATP-binding protein
VPADRRSLHGPARRRKRGHRRHGIGADLRQIIQWMVGREISDIYPRTPHHSGRAGAGIARPGRTTQTAVGSLTLARGRNPRHRRPGRRGAHGNACARVLDWTDPGGAVLVRSKEATHRTPAQRLASGMGLLSENRKEEGLMLNRSLADNLTLTRYAPLSRCGFIQRRRQRQAAQDWMDRLEVRAQDPFSDCRGIVRRQPAKDRAGPLAAS